MSLRLVAGSAALEIAPERGAEVRSLSVADRELLYRPHWTPAALGDPPLDEVAWERAWHGGWQLLWPNAGWACELDGRRHGFHGEGSVAPFAVADGGPSEAVLTCEDPYGLVCERRYALRPDGVRAEVRIENASAMPQPLMVVEHLILGGSLAADGARIVLPGGALAEQTWDGRDVRRPEAWPNAGGEDWSRLGPVPLSRFGVVRDLAGGEAEVHGEAASVRLRFALDAYPHAWLWQERRASQTPPWDGRTECLAVEPSSAPSADGLAEAVRRGEARVLAPGATFTGWLELTWTMP